MTQLYLFPAIHHVPAFVFLPLYGGILLHLLFLLSKNRGHSGLKKLLIILLSLTGILLIGPDLSSLVIKLAIFTTPFLFILFQRMEIVREGLKPFSCFVLFLWGITVFIDLVRFFIGIDSFWYLVFLILEAVLLHCSMIAYFCYVCHTKYESIASGISRKRLRDVLCTMLAEAVAAGAVMLSVFGSRYVFFFVPSFAAFAALHVGLVYLEIHLFTRNCYSGSDCGDEPANFLKDGECSEETAILLRLVRLFDTEKLYLDPEITVAEVAAKIYTNRTYLSRALNKRTSKNFSQFVNYYRVKEVCRRFISTPEARMSQLSEQCGFNTGSSFASAFRLNTGYTPVDWGKEVRRKQANSEQVSIEDYIL